MPKLYLDWNVISSLKQNRFKELFEILSRSNSIDIIYSGAHLADIKDSFNPNKETPDYIKDDLAFISQLTNNHCFSRKNDGEIILTYSDPEESLDHIIQVNEYFDDFSIESLFKGLDEVPGMNEIKKLLMKELNEIPIDRSAFEVFNLSSEETPENPSMNDFFKLFGKFYKNLNTTEEYKNLRSKYQITGLNSSHFKPNIDPYQTIQNYFSKNNLPEFNPSSIKTANEKDIWFDQIINNYLNLDMAGYQSDEIKVNENNNKTFKNTCNDAMHTAYASRCEYYVTSDRKNLNKSRAVFEYLNINTRVFTPKEFIEYFEKNGELNNFNLYLNSIKTFLKNPEKFTHSECISTDNSNISELKTNKYFFGFFNRIIFPFSPVKGDKNNEFSLILGREESHSTKYFLTRIELDYLFKILHDAFGEDDFGKSIYDPYEEFNETQIIRRWSFDELIFSLLRINGHFQFYIISNNMNELN